MSTLRTALALVVALFGMSSISNAAFVLSIHDGAVFNPSNVIVNPGDTVTINFLITQSAPDTVLSPGQAGLLGADFTATVSGTDVTPTAVSIGSGFGDAGLLGSMPQETTITGQTIRWSIIESSQISGVTTANDTGNLDPAGNSVVLGTATFAIDSNAALGLNLVTITPNVDGLGDRFFDSNINTLDIDPQTTTFNFNVSAVPEPSSGATLLILGGILSLRRRKRK